MPVGGLHDVFDRELLHRHGPHLHLVGSSRGGQITGPFNLEFGNSSAIATLAISILLTVVLGAKLFGLY